LKEKRGYLGFADKDIFINVKNIKGSNFDDILFGDEQNNIIYPFTGIDYIRTYEGNF
jgi:hypothetical protein